MIGKTALVYYTACQCTKEGLPHINLLATIEAAAHVCCRQVELRPCRFVCLFIIRFQLPQFLRPAMFAPCRLCCTTCLTEWGIEFPAKRHDPYNKLGMAMLSPNTSLLAWPALCHGVQSEVCPGRNLKPYENYRIQWS